MLENNIVLFSAEGTFKIVKPPSFKTAELCSKLS